MRKKENDFFFADCFVCCQPSQHFTIFFRWTFLISECLCEYCLFIYKICINSFSFHSEEPKSIIGAIILFFSGIFWNLCLLFFVIIFLFCLDFWKCYRCNAQNRYQYINQIILHKKKERKCSSNKIFWSYQNYTLAAKIISVINSFAQQRWRWICCYILLISFKSINWILAF